MVTTGDDVSHISGLHSIVAVFVHQLKGILEMTLIILCRAGCLMVHENLHTLGMGIFVKHLDIEVGIWGNEVKDITLPHICPVFPTNVPAFYQHLVETVLGSEVDITLHILIIGLMGPVRLNLAPVNLVEFDAGEVIGIMP